MGLGSFSEITKLADKANDAVAKITTSEIFNKVFDNASKIARRFPTPQEVANLPDPLKDSQWEMIWPSVPIFQGIGMAMNYVPIAEEISFGFPEIKNTTLDLGPSQINLPVKRTSAGTITAKFYCDMNATIINYFNEWRKLIVADDYIVGYSVDYKKVAYLYILGLRSVMPVYLIKFKGLYPLKLSQQTFSSNEKTKRITVMITFSYDDITFEPVPAGQALTTFTNNLAGNVLSQYGSVASLASKFGIGVGG